MSYQDILQAQLLNDEGEVLHGYYDSRGYLTIGVGHLIDQRRGGRISKAASRFILAEDMVEDEATAKTLFPSFDVLSDNRRVVLCNMAHNLGQTTLAQFHALISAIAADDFNAASGAMLASKWATQVQARATRLAQMMKDG